MKYKTYHFDIEMIIDHKILVIGKEPVKVSSHHILRGYKLSELVDLIRKNNVPESETVNITFNIRGVNY